MTIKRLPTQLEFRQGFYVLLIFLSRSEVCMCTKSMGTIILHVTSSLKLIMFLQRHYFGTLHVLMRPVLSGEKSFVILINVSFTSSRGVQAKRSSHADRQHSNNNHSVATKKLRSINHVLHGGFCCCKIAKSQNRKRKRAAFLHLWTVQVANFALYLI
jgi:hypothetical protein